MKAMILAAGLGTRLRPLTHVRPKVLVPLNGLRILDFWIWRLYAGGYDAVVLNAFSLGDQLCEAVRNGQWPIPVEVRVEDRLLGTGGGIRNVLDFFDEEPLTLINGDVICNVDLNRFLAHHMRSGNPASLLLHDFPRFNNVAVSAEGSILGFGQRAKEMIREGVPAALEAFTGIHAVEPDLVRAIPPGEPYDILDLYVQLIRQGDSPRAVYQEGLFWREMGSLDAYRALAKELAEHDLDFLHPLVTGKSVWVHPEAQVAGDVVLEGCVTVGRGCSVGRGVRMVDTLLWDHVTIEDGSHLCDCIVADGATVSGCHIHEVITGPLP